MAKKKEDSMRFARHAAQTTVGMTVGIVGLGVAQSAAGPLGGTTGTIIKQGAIPIAGMGMLAGAAESYKGYLPKKKK